MSTNPLQEISLSRDVTQRDKERLIMEVIDKVNFKNMKQISSLKALGPGIQAIFYQKN